MKEERIKCVQHSSANWRLIREWLQCPERNRAGFLQKANLQIGGEREGLSFARVQKSQKHALQPHLRQVSGGNKRAFMSIIGTGNHQMGRGRGSVRMPFWLYGQISTPTLGHLDLQEPRKAKLNSSTLAETPILRPPAAKNWPLGKDPDAGKDWRREEKGTTKDEMVGWHHQLDGHEFQ